MLRVSDTQPSHVQGRFKHLRVLERCALVRWTLGVGGVAVFSELFNLRVPFVLFAV